MFPSDAINNNTNNNKAAKSNTSRPIHDKNIFLFVPNLIGYARIALALVSLWYMKTNYVVAAWCYFLSFSLDEFDGMFARKLNQCSQFGALADLVIDRGSQVFLYATLAELYPGWREWFLFSLAIDIAAFWMFIHSQVLSGKKHHKKTDKKRSFLMHLYYSNWVYADCLWFFNGMFHLFLYILHYTSGPMVFGYGLWKWATIATLPIAVLRTIYAFEHIRVSSLTMVDVDLKERAKKAKDE